MSACQLSACWVKNFHRENAHAVKMDLEVLIDMAVLIVFILAVLDFFSFLEAGEQFFARLALDDFWLLVDDLFTLVESPLESSTLTVEVLHRNTLKQIPTRTTMKMKINTPRNQKRA